MATSLQVNMKIFTHYTVVDSRKKETILRTRNTLSETENFRLGITVTHARMCVTVVSNL